MTDRPDPRAFVSAMTPALRQAVSIARALEGRVPNRPKQGEATEIKAALTVADTACQEAFLVPLAERFPQVRVEAEEDTPAAGRFASSGDALVVVDPIDGTLRFFLEGLGPYAVMVGLAFDDEYAAALVALPREEIFLDAVRAGGARLSLGEAPPQPAAARADGDRVYLSHDLPEPACQVLRAAGWQPEPASGGAISVAPLIPGVRAGIRLALDSDRISIRGRVGVLIAEEAGARVSCESGEPFPRGIHTAARALLVAANGDDLQVLQRALAAAAAP